MNMKYFYFFGLFLIALLLLAGCEEEKPVPADPVTIILGEDDQLGIIEAANREIGNVQESETDGPKVSISRSDNLLQVFTQNIDFDLIDEQILILKDRENAESPIRIAVVDFDNVFDKYRITWEKATTSTSIRAFNFTLMDLIGDHNPELVCFGANAEGEQTLDVFRKIKSPTGVGLYYGNIASIQVKGSIEIEEVQRSAAYQAGHKNGVSFPIITFTRKPETAEDQRETLKRTYYWRFQKDKYVILQEEKIPGKVIEDQQLKELFRQGSKEFEDFLTGPWYHGVDSNGLPERIIVFESEDRWIIFYSGEVQEVYFWNSSDKFLSDSLQVRGTNDVTPYILKRITIYADGMDLIRITIKDIDTSTALSSGNKEWNGVYYRIHEDLLKTLIPDSESKNANTPPPELSGYYVNETGGRIYFEEPDFNLEEDGKTFQGGYALYRLEDLILEMKIIGADSLVQETRTYKADFSVSKRETEIIRTLNLHPGRIGIHGFQATDDSILRYEQVEIIEEE